MWQATLSELQTLDFYLYRLLIYKFLVYLEK